VGEREMRKIHSVEVPHTHILTFGTTPAILKRRGEMQVLLR
jgi:hypothetical protein